MRRILLLIGGFVFALLLGVLALHEILLYGWMSATPLTPEELRLVQRYAMIWEVVLLVAVTMSIFFAVILLKAYGRAKRAVKAIEQETPNG